MFLLGPVLGYWLRFSRDNPKDGYEIYGKMPTKLFIDVGMFEPY